MQFWPHCGGRSVRPWSTDSKLSAVMSGAGNLGVSIRNFWLWKSTEVPLTIPLTVKKHRSPPYKTFGCEGESSRTWNSSYDFIRDKGWRASGADTKLLAVTNFAEDFREVPTQNFQMRRKAIEIKVEKKVDTLKVLLRTSQLALAVKTDARKPDMIHVVVADGHDKSWCKVVH